MQCPVCKIDMVVVERNKIELDYCYKCRGVWFDAGELELLLKSVGLAEHHNLLRGILSSKEAETQENKRRCPICGKNMKKTNAAEHKVLVDACQRGHGLWFDGGELDQMLEEITVEEGNKKESEHKVHTFLKDTFQARKSPKA
jgi:uncharacterized protein